MSDRLLDVVDQIRGFDAIYFGAHGIPGKVPDRIGSRELMHPIRKELGLYVNYRPARLYPGTLSPLRDPGDIDFVVVRENTEGEYSGIGGRLHAGTENEIATQSIVITRRGAERVMRYAFELARKRNGKKHVWCVTKSNALAYVMELWDEVFASVAADYSDIATSKSHVDALSMYLITRPASLDVLVATNLMGDILSDEAAAVTGSIGLAASANLNPERTTPSMFEPIHGSAPDIAGKGIANPIAAIGAVVLMLDWLGEQESANLVTRAIEQILAEGKVGTPDLGGTARTTEMTDALLARIEARGLVLAT